MKSLGGFSRGKVLQIIQFKGVCGGQHTVHQIKKGVGHIWREVFVSVDNTYKEAKTDIDAWYERSMGIEMVLLWHCEFGFKH